MAVPNPFTFSQSSLQDYFDCPRRFQLRYIDRLSYPAVEAEPALESEKRLEQGQFFHRLAQQHLLGLPNDKLSRLASSPDLARWWENFQKHFQTPSDFGTLYPEFPLSVPIGEHRLLAKFDLIAVKDGMATIYDWKTYHKRPKNEWMAIRMQTRVYRYLLAAAGESLNGEQAIRPENVEMVYWFTEYPSEPAVFAYDTAQFTRDESALQKLITEIQSRAEFEKTDDEKKCAYCPYRSFCARGTKAGEWRDAETEAETLETFDINFEQVAEIAF